MKKLLVLLVLALMLCLVLCACGSNESTTSETTLPETTVAPAPLEFGSDAAYAYVYGVTGIGEFTGTDLVIPRKSAEGKTVGCIYSGAFKDCTNLKSITIPGSIRGNFDTFEGCTSLESFFVSDENSEFVAIEGVLYRNRSMLIKLERYPAAKAGTTYTVPETVEYIGECAFEGSLYLTEITLPATLESVEDCAFANCAALRTIRFGGTMAQWESINMDNWRENLVGCSVICSDGTL